MGGVHRHSQRVVHRTACLVLFALMLAPALRAAAQPPGPPSGPQATPPSGPQAAPPSGPLLAPPSAAATAPAAAPSEPMVVEVRIAGRQTVAEAKILSHLKTRPGRPFDPDTIQRDVRALHATGWFTEVKPLYEQSPQGVVVILHVTERPTLRWVRYLGNKKIKDKHLQKQTGLKVGDALDPYAVDEGRRKIEEFYRGKGYNKIQVSVFDGNKPGDLGATYIIHEGTAQRILAVDFVGNSFASDGVLKREIQSKPSILWTFRGYVDRTKIDEDLNRLTTYYRSLGFFNARVGRYLSMNERGNWLRLIFVINEGRRYVVRNISFIGNQKFSTDALNQGLTLNQNQYFNRRHMATDVSTLKDLYGSQGYVYVDVREDLRFWEEPGNLDLVYHVQEGERYRVGEISVSIGGENPHTRRQAVLNRLSFRTGDIVDIRKIRADERRLKASQLFMNDPARGVSPKIVFSPPDLATEGVAERLTGGGGAGFRGQSPEPAGRRYRANRPAERPADRVLNLSIEGVAPVDRKMVDRKPVDRKMVQRAPASSPQQHPSDQRQIARNPAGPPPRKVPQVRGQDPASGYGFPSAPPAGQPFGGRPMGALGPGPTPWTTNPTYPSTAPTHQAPPYQTAGVPPPQGGFVPPSAANGVGQNPAGQVPDPYYQPVAPPSVDPFLPFEVQVEETQTGRLMVGVGVNSEAGVVGSLIIDERNFDIGRWPTNLEDIRNGTAWRGAGQRLRMELLPGSQVQRYLISFQEPYLRDTPVSLGVSGFYYDRRYRDWDEQRVGGRVSLGYQIRPDLAGTIAYRGENVKIHGEATPTPDELAEVVGDNQLHGFKVNLTHDTRDSPFLPTEGHFIEMGVEQVVGDFDYPRATGDFRRYFLMRERPDGSGRHVVSLGTRLGFTGNNTPIYDHFFAGGFSTLRGFDFRGASPRSKGVTVGGEFMFLGSAEYLLPVTADDMLRAVAFCDFGTVEPNVRINDFRVAPGIGLRVTVPALGPAPIALDFAVPVLKADGDDTQLFSFSIGLLR